MRVPSKRASIRAGGFMNEKGMVTSVDESSVTIIPLITDACLSCKNGCAKRGKPFTVSNPKSFDISKGSIVRIGVAKNVQAVQGLVSLLFPFGAAVAGYFCASPIASLFGKSAGDGIKAICVLSFLLISAAIVFIVSRKNPVVGKPEIVEVL